MCRLIVARICGVFVRLNCDAIHGDQLQAAEGLAMPTDASRLDNAWQGRTEAPTDPAPTRGAVIERAPVGGLHHSFERRAA
jgi:hypothetical protein